jgi:hypothetical protein
MNMVDVLSIHIENGELKAIKIILRRGREKI